jgi:hypothetical protein
MNPKTKALKNQGAPTPFQIIGKGIKNVGRGIKSGIVKGAQKIMAPEVNRMKIQDANMAEMSRKAKAGEFN